jgi:hypothetical protein
VDAAIRQTALDYLEGWNDGDPARMERSLHPNLAKRLASPDGSPSSSRFPGDRLDDLNGLALVRLAARPGEAADTVALWRRAEVTILHRCANAASVRIDASTWVEYLHLCRWNGRWAIVNGLWARRPQVETL